jgi:hypothetical protein
MWSKLGGCKLSCLSLISEFPWLVILIYQAMECAQGSNIVCSTPHQKVSSRTFGKPIKVCQITQTRARKWFLLSKLELKHKTITNSHWTYHDLGSEDPLPSL